MGDGIELGPSIMAATNEEDRPADRRQLWIAGLTLLAIATHLVMRFGFGLAVETANVPLWIAYALGGVPLVWGLLGNFMRREFGSDLLAGLSIVTAVFLGEYLAGTLVILMLSGGEAIEAFAVRNASSVLKALAKRVPSVAHRSGRAPLSRMLDWTKWGWGICSKCCHTRSVRSMGPSSRGGESWTNPTSPENPT